MSGPALSKSAKDSTWYKYLSTIVKKDIHCKRQEYYFPSPEFLVQLLGIEEKERALWYSLFNAGVLALIQVLLIPYLITKPWYYTAILTTGRFVLIGAPRFFLALHFSSHVPIIKPSILNRLYIECFCCAFYGLPPGMYRYHHIVMHHKEDNIHPLDLSSTMPYQRDNILHFLYYWARFEFGIWVELPYYMIKKGYYYTFCEGVTVLGLWWVFVYYLYCYFSATVAIWFFIVPQVLTSFCLMFGNFCQHIFVNPSDFEDDHQLTINLINTPYNQLTFNDGYHIMHHKYPTMHWSQLPVKFMTDREIIKHGNANAISFNDLDYFLMGVYVFSGNLKKLAKHFVPISDKQSQYSVDEIVNLFKSRLVPIPKPEI